MQCCCNIIRSSSYTFLSFFISHEATARSSSSSFEPELSSCDTVKWKQTHTHASLSRSPNPPQHRSHRPSLSLSHQHDYQHRRFSREEPYSVLTFAPQHHGSCSPGYPIKFQKARPHQNTTPISTLARRAPSSNLNMWEERVRPQKPQLSPRISPP